MHKEPVKIKDTIKRQINFDDMGRPRAKSAHPFALINCCSPESLDKSRGNFDTAPPEKRGQSYKK